MAFYLKQEQVDLLEGVSLTSPTRHAEIYDLIHSFVQSPDPFGNAADDNVIAWFGAAKDANRGVGGASEFIRGYTAYQLEMRNGAPITGINSLIQNASNAIAQSVYEDILRSKVIKDGITYYELPTAMEIGAQDAAATVDELTNYPGGVANWSGNPLFIGLGITDFWSDNILDEDDNAHDLALSVGGMFHALGATSSTGLLDLFGLLLGQGLATASSASSAAFAAGATQSYLNRAYGDANLGIGDLVAGGMIIGSAANETLSADASQSSLGWLHAGRGADVILAATAVGEAVNECGVFDGGEGDDRMSFNNAQITAAGGVVAIISNWISGIPFSAVVTATYEGRDLDSTLFNIERLDLSDADDRLVIDSMATTLQEIDALESGDEGDTLDASDFTSAFTFDMQKGAFTAGETSLGVKNFENAIGGSGADTIMGSDQANILHGGSGADQLFGGGADDFIFFDAEDTVVNGGAGRDVAVALGSDGVTINMAEQGLECVIGCNGDDTIIVSGATESLFAAGGAGADTFRLVFGEEAESPRVLWGGDGADTFIFEDYMNGGIAVVNVAGLTEEAFANLTLDDLDLAGLPLNEFRAIIINPDASDRFVVDGSEYDTGISLEDSVFRSLGSDLISSWLGREISVQGHFADSWSTEVMAEVEWDAMENVLSISWWDGTWGGRAVKRYDPLDEAEQQRAQEDVAYYNENLVQIVVQPDTYPEYGPWNGPVFVVGGTFDGAALSGNGALTGTVPEETGPSPFDWLLVA